MSAKRSSGKCGAGHPLYVNEPCGRCGATEDEYCREIRRVEHEVFIELREALKNLVENVEHAFPALAHLGPLKDARSALQKATPPEIQS